MILGSNDRQKQYLKQFKSSQLKLGSEAEEWRVVAGSKALMSATTRENGRFEGTAHWKRELVFQLKDSKEIQIKTYRFLIIYNYKIKLKFPDHMMAFLH